MSSGFASLKNDVPPLANMAVSFVGDSGTGISFRPGTVRALGVLFDEKVRRAIILCLEKARSISLVNVRYFPVLRSGLDRDPV